MESRIKQLLEKYWSGGTTRSEEKEIKDLFSSSESDHALSKSERSYFSAMNQSGSMKSTKSFTHPGKSQRQTWLSVAASILIGLTVGIWVLTDARNQRDFIEDDPQKAYEMTRKALMMMSTNLNQGAEYSASIKKINVVQDLISDKKEN
ncbi:MAG: hypothetical protein ACI92W_001914 [Paraglaciecola sp.]|jgi:hypothetical protein